MAMTSASVTRLPTAARRKVSNPAGIAFATARIAAGIPRLPTHAERKLEADQAAHDYAESSPELLLIYSILRCIPGWQARNVRRLAAHSFAGSGEAEHLAAAALAKVASENSFGGAGA